MLTQAGDVVPDEVQNQLMILAISDVAQTISKQAPPPVPAGGKAAAAKPATGKGKKDEPKSVQVPGCTVLLHCMCRISNAVVLSCVLGVSGTVKMRTTAFSRFIT